MHLSLVKDKKKLSWHKASRLVEPGLGRHVSESSRPSVINLALNMKQLHQNQNDSVLRSMIRILVES